MHEKIFFGKYVSFHFFVFVLQLLPVLSTCAGRENIVFTLLKLTLTLKLKYTLLGFTTNLFFMMQRFINNNMITKYIFRRYSLSVIVREIHHTIYYAIC